MRKRFWWGGSVAVLVAGAMGAWSYLGGTGASRVEAQQPVAPKQTAAKQPAAPATSKPAANAAAPAEAEESYSPDDLLSAVVEAPAWAKQKGYSGMQRAQYILMLRLEATEQLLAHPKATAEQKALAEMVRLQTLHQASQMQPQKYSPLLLEYATSVLKANPNSDGGQLAQALLFQANHLDTEKLAPNVSEQLLQLARDQRNNPHLPALFEHLAERFEMDEKAPAAQSLLKQAVALLKPQGEEALGSLLRLQTRLDWIGKPIEITAPKLDGTPFKLADWKGKVVVVDFWATWCGPCIHEMPTVKAVYDKYHSQGLEMVSISLDDDKETVQRFLAKNPLPWTQVLPPQSDKIQWGNELTERFGISGIPALMVIGRDGVLRTMNTVGDGQLEAAVQAALSAK